MNYLIDEAQDVGKGADATISLFHHFLCTHGLQEETVNNCVGQNKNNATVHYLLIMESYDWKTQRSHPFLYVSWTH